MVRIAGVQFIGHADKAAKLASDAGLREPVGARK